EPGEWSLTTMWPAEVWSPAQRIDGARVAVMDALTTLHARREVEREQCGNTAVLAHQLQALLDELKPDRRSRLGVRRVEDREHWAREQPREVRMHVGVEEVCV